jgi:hypothetical protein
MENELFEKQDDQFLCVDVLLKVKELYVSGIYIKIGNGSDTNFWSGPWCGSFVLKEKSRDLFEVCNEQKEYVVDIARR